MGAGKHNYDESICLKQSNQATYILLVILSSGLNNLFAILQVY